MYTGPRFVIVIDIPHFGPRDEYVGSTSIVVASAETEKWAERIANRVEDMASSDVEVRVVDYAPRSEWSPELAHKMKEIEEYEKSWPF